jgi:hypothetical protein
MAHQMSCRKCGVQASGRPPTGLVQRSYDARTGPGGKMQGYENRCSGVMPILLVLDNFEQLPSGTVIGASTTTRADIVANVLPATPWHASRGQRRVQTL